MTTEAEARCHIYRIWHYPKPQHCFVALARPEPVSRETPPERIKIPIPPLNFDACPDGDERLKGIAKLRALEDGR